MAARSFPNLPGRPPKPDSQRRRRNKPASYGEAKPTTATAAAPTADSEVGIDGAHPLVTALWDAIQKSCEATFYSEADWQRLRLELWFVNRTMSSGQPTATAWSTIQSGFNEMLLSPAIKRRAGIEVKRQVADADEEAAVSIVGRYRQQLKSV